MAIGRNAIIHNVLRRRTDTDSHPITAITDLSTYTDKVSKCVGAEISVKSFGAKGDGVTNDSSAFQDAIAYCLLNHVGLFIPAGEYRCNIVVDTPGDLGLSIRGVSAKKTILKAVSDNTTVLAFRGVDNGVDVRQSLYHVYLCDINIQGVTSNTLNIGLELSYTQNFFIENVRFNYCYGGGMVMNDAWDSSFVNVDIVYCSRSESDSDYSYAIKMNQVVDNCNNLKFFALKVEHCAAMIYSTKNRHTYFIGCKFEKSAENKTTSYNAIRLQNMREMAFVDCMFINTHQTNDTQTYVADAGLYFILVTDASISTEHQRQRIKFIGCNFTTNGYARSEWASIVNTSLISCDFYYTRGTSTTKAPFYLKGYCEIIDCTIAVCDNTRCFGLGNKYNNVEAKINFEATSGTLASFWLDSSADYNDIKYTLYKNGMTANYILGSSFEANGYMYLVNNHINEKYPTAVTTSAATVVMRGHNVAKVGGNVSLISHVQNGQIVTLIATGAITITNGAYLITKSGADVNMTTGQVMQLICIDGIMREI